MDSDESMSSYVKIDGVIWPSATTEDALRAIKDSETYDDDVWVATYPKAGTHWVSEICHLVNHEGHLEKVDRQQVQTPLEFTVDTGLAEVQTTPHYELARKWTRPRVMVSHVPVEYLPRQVLEEGRGRVISVIRNPKDSIVSEFYFAKGFLHGAPESFSQCLKNRVSPDRAPYKTWFGHVLGYWPRRHQKNFLILKFEEMKQDTRGAVIQIADFMGRPLSDEVIDKIVDLVQVKSMKERFYSTGESADGGKKKAGARNLMRKGVVGDWKTHFTVVENEAFDALYREKMADSGLKLQFE